MNFYQAELWKIAAGCEHFHLPRCVGRECLGRLTEDVTIKLSFCAMGIANQYDALKIRLINRHEGDIDTQFIRLGELWGKVRMRAGGKTILPHIWDDKGDVHWYGFTPTLEQYDALSHAVNVYLSAYSEPEQTESEEMDYTM